MATKKAAKQASSKKLSGAALASLAMPHEDIVGLMSTDDPDPKPPFLGHPKAIIVVTAAANTSPTNLSRSLKELGVNGIAFQKSVFAGVKNAGYTIAFDNIPNSPDSTLIEAVTVIQNATATV